MRVLKDTGDTRARYERLVESSGDASVYQTLDWLLVFASLGCELSFVETDEESLIPFVCKGSGAFRRAFSLPYDTYGGPVGANAPVSYDEIVRALGIPSARIVDFAAQVDSTTCKAHRVATHLVGLAGGYEAVEARYSTMNRRAIRQARRRGVRVEPIENPRLLLTFWKLYRRTMSKYRTPPLPLRFFEALYGIMVPNDRAKFYLAWHGRYAVAGNLVLRYRNQAYDWSWGYDETQLHLRPTNALIDRAICDEIAAGSTVLNLGASPSNGNGNVQFKESFGAEVYPYRILSKVGFMYQAARFVRRRGITPVADSLDGRGTLHWRSRTNGQ